MGSQRPEKDSPGCGFSGPGDWVLLASPQAGRENSPLTGGQVLTQPRGCWRQVGRVDALPPSFCPFSQPGGWACTCCSLLPAERACPLLAQPSTAVFGLNYFFEPWSHYFWTIIWSGTFSCHGFLLFSLLFTLLDVLPKASFHSSFGVVFITFMHLNLSRKHCHPPA